MHLINDHIDSEDIYIIKRKYLYFRILKSKFRKWKAVPGSQDMTNDNYNKALGSPGFNIEILNLSWIYY